MKPGVGVVYESSGVVPGLEEEKGKGGESKRNEKGNTRYESKAKQIRTGNFIV